MQSAKTPSILIVDMDGEHMLWSTNCLHVNDPHYRQIESMLDASHAVATVDEVKVDDHSRPFIYLPLYQLSRCLRRLHEGSDLFQILFAVCFYTAADIDAHDLFCLIAETLNSLSDVVRAQTSGE